jgi:2-iminobutanoate/2-iminopropanoate deaminase
MIMNREIINTIKAPAAIGPYSHGNKIGDLIFTSGQLPINPETKELITEIKAATRQSLENVKGILEEVGSSMDKVVKATVFVKDLGQFGEVNEVYSEYFGKNSPARSCVQVAKLPMDAVIEIEVIAHV